MLSPVSTNSEIDIRSRSGLSRLVEFIAAIDGGTLRLMSGVQYPSIGLPMECAGDELASEAEGGLPLLARRPLPPAELAAANDRRLSSD